MRLREIGEDALIRRIRERFPSSGGVLGIGDDAAVFDLPAGHSAVYCSDLVAEGTHFLRTLHPADSVGYKAVAVNVSDIGAMGGVPLHFVISLAAPGDLEVEWVDSFYSGVERACREFGVTLVGGDTSSAASIFVDVSMIGHVPSGQAVRRSGAKPGDNLFVTGTLGGSARGLSLLKAGVMDDPSIRRHLYPQPRHRVGALFAGRAHAMIDVSDGLSTDLNRLVTDSRVSARIYQDKLPAALNCNTAEVLHGGEEYELIIVLAGKAADIPSAIEGVSISWIGEIVTSTGESQISLVEQSSESILRPQGWEHYSRQDLPAHRNVGI
jgi:thiamine-monophosphate kinase